MFIGRHANTIYTKSMDILLTAEVFKMRRLKKWNGQMLPLFLQIVLGRTLIIRVAPFPPRVTNSILKYKIILWID